MLVLTYNQLIIAVDVALLSSDLHCDVPRASDDDRVRHQLDVGPLQDARHLVRLVLVYCVKVRHGIL